MKKLGIFGVIVGAIIAIGLLIGINCYTTVDAGSVKVGKFLGEVDTEVYSEGFHFVNPFMGFTKYDIQERNTHIPQVSIPAQDNFSSTAEMTIRWSLDPSYAVTTKKNIGDMNALESKIIRSPLLSLIKEAGRAVKESQDLFKEETQKAVEAHILNGLIAETSEYGITIHAVYLGNIDLDDVIDSAVRKAKEKNVQIREQQSELEKKALQFEEQVREAQSKEQAAEANKKAAKHNSDAAYYEKTRQSDAQLYQTQKEALGITVRAKAEASANTMISKSVTPNLLKLRTIEVEMKRAEQWNGGVPQTVLGGEGTNKVLPLYNVN